MLRGLLRLPLGLPLVEPGGGDDATLPAKGRAKRGLLLQGLGSGIDGFGEDIRIRDPARDEAPEGQVRHQAVFLWTDNDDVLPWGDVVALLDVEPLGDHAEGVCQALRVEGEGVTATHG